MAAARPGAGRTIRRLAWVLMLVGLLVGLQLAMRPWRTIERTRIAPAVAAGLVAPRATAAARAPPANRSGTFDAVLGALPAPPGSTVVLTFGTVGVLDFLLNWYGHVEAIPEMEPVLVAALDREVLAAAAARGARAFLAPQWEIIADRGFTPERQHRAATDYFRGDLSAFKKMGYVKALTLAALLARGHSALVSDVDVVFLRHPWGVIDAPGKPRLAPPATPAPEPADLLVGTDNVELARDTLPHRLLESEINTGLLFARASPTMAAFVREWALRCLHTRDGHDQQELNHLLKGCYPVEPAAGAAGAREPADRHLDSCTLEPFPPTLVLAAEGGADGGARVWIGNRTYARADPDVPARGTHGARDRRRLARDEASLRALAAAGVRPLQWMWHGRLRAGVLPMRLFTGGHPYFVQHVASRPGAPAPVAVHLSWGFGDLYGKRERLREMGWWREERAAHFAEGSFVRVLGVERLYERAVAPWAAVAAVCAPSDTDARACWHPARLVDPDLARARRDPRAAIDPAAPQLAAQAALRRALRNGFALAEASGRTLVLPELRCYCERFWWLLQDCRVAGAEDMALPFVCPFDFVFEPYWWDTLGVQRRHASFWTDPRVPAALLASTARLRIKGDGDGGGETGGEGGAGGGDGGGDGLRGQRPVVTAYARHGPDAAARAVAAVPAAASARVLEIDALELASLGSCSERGEGARVAFNDKMARLLGGHSVEYCSRERNLFLGTRGRARARAQARPSHSRASLSPPSLNARGSLNPARRCASAPPRVRRARADVEAPFYTSRKRDAKEALNCSYPGADAVVANPITWPRLISEDNRRRWYGGDLGPSPGACGT